MKIIIPTKGRADVIGQKALRLFPGATLCVDADEADTRNRLEPWAQATGGEAPRHDL